MTQTFKILSLLLSYPSADLQSAIPELRGTLNRKALLGVRERTALAALLSDLEGGDLLDLQERYVFLFDRTRSLSLHLFEHVHGEGRDRGQAMVDLMALYDEHGLEISARELPDYLPLFLEFLALLPIGQARDLLQQPLHILSALKERLRKRHSVYACIFAALERIAEGKADSALLEGLLAEPEDDPSDLAALDRIWEEEAVSFGNNAGEGACGVDRIRTQDRAARRKPADPQPQQRSV